MPTSLFAGLCLLGSATRFSQQAPCERRLWAQMSKVRVVCKMPGAHLGRPRILMWPGRTCQHVGAEEARPKDNTNNDNNDLHAGLASMLVQRGRAPGYSRRQVQCNLPAQVQGGCPCAMDAALLGGAPSELPWQISAKVAGSGAKSCATSSCTSQVKRTQDLLQAALRTYIPAFMCRKRVQTSRRSLLQAARRTRCTADGPAPGFASGRLLPIPPQSSQQLVCLGRARDAALLCRMANLPACRLQTPISLKCCSNAVARVTTCCSTQALQIAAPLWAQQIPPVSQFRFAEPKVQKQVRVPPLAAGSLMAVHGGSSKKVCSGSPFSRSLVQISRPLVSQTRILLLEPAAPQEVGVLDSGGSIACVARAVLACMAAQASKASRNHVALSSHTCPGVCVPCPCELQPAKVLLRRNFQLSSHCPLLGAWQGVLEWELSASDFVACSNNNNSNLAADRAVLAVLTSWLARGSFGRAELKKADAQAGGSKKILSGQLFSVPAGQLRPARQALPACDSLEGALVGTLQKTAYCVRCAQKAQGHEWSSLQSVHSSVARQPPIQSQVTAFGAAWFNFSLQLANSKPYLLLQPSANWQARPFRLLLQSACQSSQSSRAARNMSTAVASRALRKSRQPRLTELKQPLVHTSEEQVDKSWPAFGGVCRSRNTQKCGTTLFLHCKTDCGVDAALLDGDVAKPPAAASRQYSPKRPCSSSLTPSAADPSSEAGFQVARLCRSATAVVLPHRGCTMLHTLHVPHTSKTKSTRAYTEAFPRSDVCLSTLSALKISCIELLRKSALAGMPRKTTDRVRCAQEAKRHEWYVLQSVRSSVARQPLFQSRINAFGSSNLAKCLADLSFQLASSKPCLLLQLSATGYARPLRLSWPSACQSPLASRAVQNTSTAGATAGALWKSRQRCSLGLEQTSVPQPAALGQKLAARAGFRPRRVALLHRDAAKQLAGSLTAGHRRRGVVAALSYARLASVHARYPRQHRQERVLTRQLLKFSRQPEALSTFAGLALRKFMSDTAHAGVERKTTDCVRCAQQAQGHEWCVLQSIHSSVARQPPLQSQVTAFGAAWSNFSLQLACQANWRARPFRLHLQSVCQSSQSSWAVRKMSTAVASRALRKSRQPRLTELKQPLVHTSEEQVDKSWPAFGGVCRSRNTQKCGTTLFLHCMTDCGVDAALLDGDVAKPPAAASRQYSPKRPCSSSLTPSAADPSSEAGFQVARLCRSATAVVLPHRGCTMLHTLHVPHTSKAKSTRAYTEAFPRSDVCLSTLSTLKISCNELLRKSALAGMPRKTTDRVRCAQEAKRHEWCVLQSVRSSVARQPLFQSQVTSFGAAWSNFSLQLACQANWRARPFRLLLQSACQSSQSSRAARNMSTAVASRAMRKSRQPRLTELKQPLVHTSEEQVDKSWPAFGGVCRSRNTQKCGTTLFLHCKTDCGVDAALLDGDVAKPPAAASRQYSPKRPCSSSLTPSAADPSSEAGFQVARLCRSATAVVLPHRGCTMLHALHVPHTSKAKSTRAYTEAFPRSDVCLSTLSTLKISCNELLRKSALAGMPRKTTDRVRCAQEARRHEWCVLQSLKAHQATHVPSVLSAHQATQLLSCPLSFHSPVQDGFKLQGGLSRLQVRWVETATPTTPSTAGYSLAREGASAWAGQTRSRSIIPSLRAANSQCWALQAAPRNEFFCRRCPSFAKSPVRSQSLSTQNELLDHTPIVRCQTLCKAGAQDLLKESFGTNDSIAESAVRQSCSKSQAGFCSGHPSQICLSIPMAFSSPNIQVRKYVIMGPRSSTSRTMPQLCDRTCCQQPARALNWSLGMSPGRNYSPACVLGLNRGATCPCISGASLHATCSGPAMLCKHSLLSKVVKVASLLPQAVKGASFLSVDPLVAACPPKQMSISAPQLAVVAAEDFIDLRVLQGIMVRSPTGLVPLDSKVFVAQSLGFSARQRAGLPSRQGGASGQVPTQGRQPVCISGGRKCSVPAPPTTPPSPWMHSLELILLTPDMHAHDAAMVSSASEVCYEVAPIADFTLQGTLRDFEVCSNSGGPVGALKHLGGSSYKRLSLLPQDPTRTRLPGQTTNFCQAARTLAVAYELQDPSTFLPLAFSYARIAELPAVTSSLPVVALQSTPWLLQPPASMLCGVGPKLTGADCARAQGSKWAGIDASSCAAEVAAKALLSSRCSPLSSQQDLTSCLQSDLAHDAGLAVSEECKQLPALIKVYHRGGATARLIIKEVSIKKAPQIAAPVMPASHPCATRASVQQVTLALNCGKRSLAVKPPCRCLLPCHGGAATCCPGSKQLLTHAQRIFASTRSSATPVLCHLLSERLDTLPSAHTARVTHLHFRWAPISGVIEKTAENRAVRVRPCSVAPTCRVPLFSQVTRSYSCAVTGIEGTTKTAEVYQVCCWLPWQAAECSGQSSNKLQCFGKQLQRRDRNVHDNNNKLCLAMHLQPLPLLAASSFVAAIPSMRCNNGEVQQQLKSSSRLINVVPDMPLRNLVWCRVVKLQLAAGMSSELAGPAISAALAECLPEFTDKLGGSKDVHSSSQPSFAEIQAATSDRAKAATCAYLGGSTVRSVHVQAASLPVQRTLLLKLGFKLQDFAGNRVWCRVVKLQLAAGMSSELAGPAISAALAECLPEFTVKLGGSKDVHSSSQPIFVEIQAAMFDEAGADKSACPAES
ncbi:unnamed protein product [Polarella glacialis]|uniref:Uncharacterized protein n=1 Tax=Polarella glacialis TaxID=89957 RepID=A0A813E7K7_POLGL|nr:unnamed protein product [Polarella glacialis]